MVRQLDSDSELVDLLQGGIASERMRELSGEKRTRKKEQTSRSPSSPRPVPHLRLDSGAV